MAVRRSELVCQVYWMLLNCNFLFVITVPVEFCILEAQKDTCNFHRIAPGKTRGVLTFFFFFFFFFFLFAGEQSSLKRRLLIWHKASDVMQDKGGQRSSNPWKIKPEMQQPRSASDGKNGSEGSVVARATNQNSDLFSSPDRGCESRSSRTWHWTWYR